MTDTHLYFAIGMPTFTILLAFIGTVLQVNLINARLTSIDNRISSLETSFNARLTSLETRFETLIGKVIGIDNRLTRLEERLERH